MKKTLRFFVFGTALLLPLLVSAAALGTRAANSSGADVTETNITLLTAGLLGASQFAHQPLDDGLAGAFLDRYLEMLDGDRSLFLESDVAQFAAGRVNLAQETRSRGDTRMGHVVFARYLQRLEQRVAFINDALRNERFEFLGNDDYSLDRELAPRPRDLAAARAVWRQRLRFDYLQEKLDDKTPQQIVKTLSGRADRLLQAMRQMDRDAVLEIYLSALAHVYDPHSDYLGREQLGEFNIAMNLSLFGIGAKLQSEDGHCRIVELLPGGPAARSGLLAPGDRIVAVGQDGGEAVDIVDMPLSRAVELIRGPKGSVVDLTIIPADAADDSVRATIPLVRDEVKLEERRAKARIVDMPGGDGSTLRLGVVDLPSFYADVRGASADDPSQATSATADVALLLQKLKAENVEGVVLDLRLNGGGSLDEAISLTGLFIETGPVVQTRGPAGDIDIGADGDPAVIYDGPLVVLTSRFSASASEILAGALQDYGRAVIVGDASTFGKGTVQSVVRLAPIMQRSGLKFSHEPGALTVTIRKFYRPSGASTQLKGVVPDIVLPSLTSTSGVGESDLDNPLPWDSVPSVAYQQFGMVRPYVATLRENSARRVTSGEEFHYLRSEMARVAQRRAAKSVSLNEAERRREIASFELRRKEHEKAQQNLARPLSVTYELSVHDAVLPGLPPPTVLAEEALATELGLAEDAATTRLANRSPQRDVILAEARNILADYLSLVGRGPGAGTVPLQVRVKPARASH